MTLGYWPDWLVALVGWLAKKLQSDHYRRTVGTVRDFFHILWICRVATASVGIGFVLMSCAPQVLDLFQEVPGFLHGTTLQNLVGSLVFAILFAGSVLIIWAIPLHGAARWSLDSLADPPRTLLGSRFQSAVRPRAQLNPVLVEYVPRGLGLACFFVVGIGIVRAYAGVFDPDIVASAQIAESHLAFLLVSVIVAAALFIAYVRWRLDVFDRLARRTRFQVTVNRQEHAHTVEGPGVMLLRMIAVGTVGFVSLLLVFYTMSPGYGALEARAWLVPIVLGAWVPVLSVMTWFSYAFRVPILTVLLIGIVGYKYFAGEGHEVRTMPGDTTSAVARLEIGEAVRRWMVANGCANNPGNCPPPIVVAAAGGGSRAAYMTASTLGYFMDMTCSPRGTSEAPELPCKSADIPLFADRIFAISAVSGGALGAAVFSALLKSQQERVVREPVPCSKGAHGRFWFRPGSPRGWRDCVQLVLSEDFLSPPVLGLAFRDQLPPFALVGARDRAAVLEDALTAAFARYASGAEADTNDGGTAGLAAPFEQFAPDEKHWRPLLVFNGTSVATGRRIVTSHMTFEGKPHGSAGQRKALFDDAYDFFDLIGSEERERGGREFPVRTVSLATAVTNSGRFPILTPAGALRDGSPGTFRDRIVDGGYFENYGITSAYEIARELQRRKLQPQMLLITSEPISRERVLQFDLGDSVPPAPKAAEGMLFPSILAPFLALYGTRDSRGDLAVFRTSEGLIPDGADGGRVPKAHIAVYGVPADGSPPPPGGTTNGTKFKEVSMSLWLSKPVQEYLDDQFFERRFSAGLQQAMLLRVCGWLDHPAIPDFAAPVDCSRGVDEFSVPKPAVPKH